MGYAISIVLCCIAQPQQRYDNHLERIANAKPILADYPQYVQPIDDANRFRAAPVVDEMNADLEVRAWRFSYNARGIIEMPNRLRASATAIVVVHPWGIDDGQGWTSPEPAGVAFFCTPEKNKICEDQLREVVNPFLKSLRDKVKVVSYSMPGAEDPIRKKMYRSFRTTPSDAERVQGRAELAAKLKAFSYKGSPLSVGFSLAAGTSVPDYFKNFSGLDASAKFNNQGFWQLPVPVHKAIEVHANDVVIYDGEGYSALRDFLKSQGIRHVLLAGYATDMCLISTCAGYQNLSKDFNLFIVGDATMATFPAVSTPRYATQTALAKAALNQLITQVSWIRPMSLNHRGTETQRKN